MQIPTRGVGFDLTGSIVSSDKPVAVFGGNRCTDIPGSGGFFFCDQLVEQPRSTDTWGKSFVTVPLATRSGGDTFRFLASVNGTTVNVNGAPVATLNRGDFHETIRAGASTVTANEPIQVAQYSNSSTVDSVTSDLFMMLIPPFEQFLGDYTVSTPASGFTTNFVNVVAPDAAVGLVMLDGAPIPAGDFSSIGSSGFSGAQVSVALGSHTLVSTFPFGAFSYGFAPADSYGYPGGASYAPPVTVTDLVLTPETDTNPVGTDHTVTATVTDSNSDPVEGARVDFDVTGANPTSGFAFTDASGQAPFTYTGVNPGTDTITASLGALSDVATKEWASTPASCSDDVLISNYHSSLLNDNESAQFVKIANVGNASIDLDGCSLVTFDVFTQLSIGAGTVDLSGSLAPGATTQAWFSDELPAGPGGIGVFDLPAPPDGTPFSTDDEITGMVYLQRHGLRCQPSHRPGAQRDLRVHLGRQRHRTVLQAIRSAFGSLPVGAGMSQAR